MTNSDLIWHLVQLILEKENNTKQPSINQIQNNESNAQQHDET